MQFYENPSGKSRAVTTGQDGRREGHDKFKSQISQPFFEYA